MKTIAKYPDAAVAVRKASVLSRKHTSISSLGISELPAPLKALYGLGVTVQGPETYHCNPRIESLFFKHCPAPNIVQLDRRRERAMIHAGNSLRLGHPYVSGCSEPRLKLQGQKAETSRTIELTRLYGATSTHLQSSIDSAPTPLSEKRFVTVHHLRNSP